MPKTKDGEQMIDALRETVEHQQAHLRKLSKEHPKAAAAAKRRKPKTLTDLTIRKAKPGTWLADPHHRGLRLYKGDGGLGSWWYRYRSLTRQDADGLPMLDSIKLGDYPSTELTEARSLWKTLKLKRRNGVDPKASNATKAVYTCKQLVDDYIKGYAGKLNKEGKPMKRGWRNDERILYKDVMSRFEDQPATLSRDEAKTLLTEVAERGDEAARQLLAITRKAWNYAIEEGRVAINPFQRLKIVNGVVMSSDANVRSTKKKKAYWDDLSLQKFLRWLPGSDLHPRIQQIARFQLLTACRPGEACGMAWSEVDFERGTWTIPPERHKAGKEHKVMLSAQAVALLQSLDRVGEFVFPSFQDYRTACRYNWYSHQWKRQVETAPAHYIVPHALRHTVITGLAKLQCPQEITTRIAGHAADGITEEVYTHYERDVEARAWLQIWADHLDALQTDSVLVR